MEINKVCNMSDVIDQFTDGLTLMIGGFMDVGTPQKLVNALAKKGVKNLTTISNDTAYPQKGIGILIDNRQIKKSIVSHIGTNPETGRQMTNGELEVILVPQGTLAERIRCGGTGLGGLLTPTGLGTIVEEGKQKIEVDGKTYLLELPLRADIALIKAYKADILGNLVFRRSARNFNPLMAMAADLTIVEAEKILGVGELDPDEIITPGVFVDMVIPGWEEDTYV